MSGKPGRIPLAPLREAFLRGDTTAVEIARHMDWFTPSGHPDSPRVRRTLGLRPTRQRSGRSQARSAVSFDLAQRLADALGLDPFEVGL